MTFILNEVGPQRVVDFARTVEGYEAHTKTQMWEIPDYITGMEMG